MIKITFPDNTSTEFSEGITGLEIAKHLSNRLAKEVLAIGVNGETWDLTRPIYEDASVELYKWEDEEGKHTFWHSSAHLMAEALSHLYPDVKFAIGPAIEHGFYYDIEPGDDTVISEKDFPAIEQKMLELARQKNEFNRKQISKQDAIQFYKEHNNTYKVELLREFKDEEITLYSHGSFIDLCRGPHLPHTGYIKAVKLLNIAGAYWKGNEENTQLTRIYGITFPKQKMLDEYLEKRELAKQRDHRKLGRELELFTFSDQVGRGLPLWLPKGAFIREHLEDFLKKIQRSYGYEQLITPHIGKKSLYVTSGHYEKYGKDSFQPIETPDDEEEFLLKPMNCPHHCEIFKSRPHSYRDLPIRYAEFGTVYRYEQSGELHGLTRARGFTQDDAHIFCTPEQLKDEFKKVIDIILYIFKTLHLNDYSAQISLRDPNNPDQYIGTDDNWAKAEEAIIEAAKEKELETTVMKGEAAFYGPKLDFMIRDTLDRKWQAGTIQVDYNLPDRFELEYTAEDNSKKRPVMIHRAPFGSMERFIALLLEHNGGKFPLWLTPDQAVILPISEKFNNYAQNVLKFLNISDIRTTIDDRNEKIGRKIRDNELKKIPYLLIIGEKEVENETISVRKQGEGDIGSMSQNEFINLIKDKIHSEIQE